MIFRFYMLCTFLWTIYLFLCEFARAWRLQFCRNNVHNPRKYTLCSDRSHYPNWIHNERIIYVQITCFSWHKISKKRSMYQLEDSTQQNTRARPRFPLHLQKVTSMLRVADNVDDYWEITRPKWLCQMNILTTYMYYPGADNPPKCIGT